ncbi:MAG: hypothetical protein ABR974_07285 [Bacteroidales bacterium]
MKKSFIALLFLGVFGYPLTGQNATNFTYKFDNGIVVKTDHDWGHIWIQQKQDAFAPNEEKVSVVISLRTFGDPPQSTTSKLTLAGKEVKLKDAAPGTYDLKITSKLAGKPGSISFDAQGIIVKPKMKTTVTVIIYNYQVSIEETAMSNKGLAGYDSRIAWYKGNLDETMKVGAISFFAKGAHDKKLVPDAATNDISGKIKPGTYDVMISIDISGHSQKVWLENFTIKPDVNYKILTNMNAGTISYAGVNRDVRKLYLYPAGTADRLQGVAKPDKASEVISYEPAGAVFACPPGSYDVLLGMANGTKFEWKKGLVVRTGTRTDVK